MKTTNNTTQINGNHYDLEIEPVHIMAALRFNWFQGEILKYVSLHHRKNGISDINKSIHVCDMADDLLVDTKGDPVLFNKYTKLIDKYIAQFLIHDQFYLRRIINDLYFLSWDNIRESIILYKEHCYEKR